LASLTLGLAPFVPQPHVVEKLRWLATGRALAPIDMFDLVLHGAPWLWLFAEVGFWAAQRLKKSPPTNSTVPSR
jgi:hypothetical protein